MASIGERLKAERLARGLTLVEAAAVAGTTKQSLSQIESGRTHSPNGMALEAWSRYYGVNLKWLTTGKGPRASAEAPQEGDWQDVKGYAQAVGLGKGAEAQEYAETHSLKFRASSFARKGLKPQNMAVMYGEGDSMEPRIHAGDAILFDTSDRRIVDGGLYVIQKHGKGNSEVFVKRALVLDDTVFFAADNPGGDHSWRKPKRMDAAREPIEVLGRVRWVGSWVD